MLISSHRLYANLPVSLLNVTPNNLLSDKDVAISNIAEYCDKIL